MPEVIQPTMMPDDPSRSGPTNPEGDDRPPGHSEGRDSSPDPTTEPGSTVPGASTPTPSRSGARARRYSGRRLGNAARREFRFQDWEGEDATLIDPRMLLLQVAGNVMARYERQYSLRGAKMPSHLRRPPSDKIGWGGRANDSALRDWIWVRIARRCLRRRFDPAEFIDLIAWESFESRYPPPLESYLEQIDARQDEMRARMLERVKSSTRSSKQMLDMRYNYWSELTEFEEDAHEYALEDSSIDPDKVYVYCHAWKFRFRAIAAPLAPVALIKYACAKEAYDLGYGKLIPEPFATAGAALYQLVDLDGD